MSQAVLAHSIWPKRLPVSYRFLTSMFPAWTKDAACLGKDPARFEVDLPSSMEMTRPVAAAKRICLSCNVRRECLAYALEHDYGESIFGGLASRERRRIAHSISAHTERLEEGERLLQAQKVGLRLDAPMSWGLLSEKETA